MCLVKRTSDWLLVHVNADLCTRSRRDVLAEDFVLQPLWIWIFNSSDLTLAESLLYLYEECRFMLSFCSGVCSHQFQLRKREWSLCWSVHWRRVVAVTTVVVAHHSEIVWTPFFDDTCHEAMTRLHRMFPIWRSTLLIRCWWVLLLLLLLTSSSSLLLHPSRSLVPTHISFRDEYCFFVVMRQTSHLSLTISENRRWAAHSLLCLKRQKISDYSSKFLEKERERGEKPGNSLKQVRYETYFLHFKYDFVCL